jgi:hypothetical protein
MALSSTVPLITACGEQIGTVVAQKCAAAAEVEVFDHLQHACTLPESNRTDAEWVCWSAIQEFAELAIRGPLQREESPRLDEISSRVVDTVIKGLCISGT